MFLKEKKSRKLWPVIIVLACIALTPVIYVQLKDRSYYTDVFAWFPDNRILKISPRGNGIFYEPHIHPEGTQVVYFGNTTGHPRIWKTDLTTLVIAPLTSPEFGARHPAFSWDGLKIAFASDMHSGQEPENIDRMGKNGLPPKDHITNIFIMDSNGESLQQVTFGAFQDQRPSFSPDGKTIVFVSNREGGMHLWKIDIGAEENSHPDPVPLQKEGYGYRPYFSTDGQWIFFFSKINGRDQVCKIPADGGEIIPLQNDRYGQSHGPFPDPEGKYLLIHSYREEKFTLWKLPLDGSPPQSIQPPGFYEATHATMSRNGIITFDVPRYRRLLRRTAVKVKRMLMSLGVMKPQWA